MFSINIKNLSQLSKESLSVFAFGKQGEVDELVYKTRYMRQKEDEVQHLYVRISLWNTVKAWDLLEMNWSNEKNESDISRKIFSRINDQKVELSERKEKTFFSYVPYGAILDLEYFKVDLVEDSKSIQKQIRAELKKYEDNDFFTIEKLPLSTLTEYRQTKNYFVNDGKEGDWYKIPYFPDCLIPVFLDDSLYFIHSDEGSSPGFLCLRRREDSVKIEFDEWNLGYLHFEEIKQSQKEIHENIMEDIAEGRLPITG